jgi:flavorubredoxin
MAAILVLYHSQQHGNTRQMAEAVADGAREAGAQVRLANTDQERLKIDEYRKVEAAAFGSPDYFSYIAGGLKVFLDDWFIAKNADPDGLQGKPYALFYSHGGGGRVKGPLEKLFAAMGTKVGKTVECQGKPGKEVIAACRELGRQLAEAVAK